MPDRTPGSLGRLLLTLLVLPAMVSAVSAVSACSPRNPEQTSGPAGSSAAAEPTTDAAAPSPASECAGLSRRDKLAQLLMVGVKDAADARSVVNDHHVGGIFVGSWTDLSMLTDGSLKELADSVSSSGPLPLAVSTDEEGGRVSRLAKLIGTQPSPRELGRTSTPGQVYQIALDRGRAMRKLGITVDFAPVVDVTEEQDDDVIGDRSFGSDPQTVTTLAGAYASGLRAAGVLPVIKHFPGHGHGSGDSHTAGVVVTPPLDQLQNNDLVPYRTLVDEAPVAVMIGHLQVEGLTGDDPASLSPAVVKLLREGTDYQAPPFDGVVFSDDLSSMAAINEHYGVAEAVLRALRAGIDVALWITTDEVPAVLDHLEEAMAANDLKPAVVDAALARVALAKNPMSHCTG